jgi:cytochrome c oxidase cbb3-type subunit III
MWKRQAERVAIGVCLVWAGSGMAELAVFAADFQPLPTSKADLAQGEKLFRNHCGLCHGPKGEGDRGPMLTRAKLRRAPDDETLVKILTDGIRGTEMPGAENQMSEHEIRQTAAYVRSLGKINMKPVPGDPASGAALYRGKGNCAACHSLNGMGGVAGPDLTDIGERRSADYLRESLINPEADLPEGYLLVTVAAKDGQSVSGVRINEDSFSIQVRDSAGRSYSFWKADVSNIDRQRGKSGMPSYKGRITDADLTDLVAYLASLKPSATGDVK